MKLPDSIKPSSLIKAIQKNLLLFISFVVSYTLYFVIFIQTVSYSRLNLMIYSFAFIFIFVIILILSIISFEGIYEKKKRLRRIGFSGFLILSLLFGTASFYLFRINASISNVIVDSNEKTVLDIAFVTYNNTKIKALKDISNVKLAILSNSETSDRNSFVKSEVEKQALNVQFVEYLSYNEMLLGLFSKEVDVAALPNDYVNQFEGYEGYSDYLDKTSIVHEFSVSVESTQDYGDIDVAKEPFTVLIMGNDGGRTDSMILATYNPYKLAVTMTSIPRDSYVPIACYPNQQKDKIGHAFAVSRDCAIETVENLMDVNINYYVVVNFQGVVDIVDALDKIWIESPLEFVGQNSSDERGHYTVWIPKGGFWATGEQALTFSRERHQMPGGDFQRQQNQQQVIQSIIDRTLNLNDVNKAVAVLDAAGKNIETNMPLNQMITIFNGLISAVNRTSVTPGFILDITGSQVLGYGSYTYNEPMELPLWISVPYKGSLEDNKNLIQSNLTETKTLPTEVKSQFNANSVFFKPDYFLLTYNEKEVHEVLPDFMPNMTNNNWTLENVKTWANSRAITITVNPVKEGDAKFSASLVHNYIVGQSVRYGVKTSKFNSLTVDVIKQNLDCKIEANMVYDECKYKLPDFVTDKTKLVDVQTWAKNNGITLKYIIIPETDASYDKTKIGYVIKQTPETLADIRTISEITLTIMDPNFNVTIPNTSSWNLETAKQWVSTNLSEPTNYTVVYVPTTDPAKYNLVSSVSPTTTIKYNQILTLNVFAEGMVLSDYTGKTIDEVKAALCTPGLVQCDFTNQSTTDATLDKKIQSQSIPSGALKLKTEWSTTTVTFTVYALAATPPSSN